VLNVKRCDKIAWFMTSGHMTHITHASCHMTHASWLRHEFCFSALSRCWFRIVDSLIPSSQLGSRTVEPELKFRAPGISKYVAPVPKWFCPFKNLKTIASLHKLCLLNENSNFRLRLQHPKLLGLRLHSPGWKFYVAHLAPSSRING